jgi:hypothetical protein
MRKDMTLESAAQTLNLHFETMQPFALLSRRLKKELFRYGDNDN